MEVLNDAERRFSRKLVDAMLPELVNVYWDIWEETKKETKDRKHVENYRQNLQGQERVVERQGQGSRGEYHQGVPSFSPSYRGRFRHSRQDSQFDPDR